MFSEASRVDHVDRRLIQFVLLDVWHFVHRVDRNHLRVQLRLLRLVRLEPVQVLHQRVIPVRIALLVFDVALDGALVRENLIQLERIVKRRADAKAAGLVIKAVTRISVSSGCAT